MPKAKNLKTLRKRQNLTQERLADALCVSKSTVIAWEKRKHAIPEPAARRIADFFNVDYHDFCDADMDAQKIALTEEEAEDIRAFRKLPKEMQKAVRTIIHGGKTR